MSAGRYGHCWIWIGPGYGSAPLSNSSWNSLPCDFTTVFDYNICFFGSRVLLEFEIQLDLFIFSDWLVGSIGPRHSCLQKHSRHFFWRHWLLRHKNLFLAFKFISENSDENQYIKKWQRSLLIAGHNCTVWVLFLKFYFFSSGLWDLNCFQTWLKLFPDLILQSHSLWETLDEHHYFRSHGDPRWSMGEC